MPQYDLPPAAFKKRESYPGDLSVSNEARGSDASQYNTYLTLVPESESVYMSMDGPQKRRESEQYVQKTRLNEIKTFK